MLGILCFGHIDEWHANRFLFLCKLFTIQSDVLDSTQMEPNSVKLSSPWKDQDSRSYSELNRRE